MEQPTITITVPVNSVDLGGALDAARALTSHLEAAQEMLGRLSDLVEKGYVHGPKAPARKSVSARRERRAFTDDQKRAGAALAREVGATKAAQEYDVVPTTVRGWLKKHPKEHAVAEPIKGTPPRVGENREDWEARHRAASAASM